MSHHHAERRQGVSLAKGPVGLVGVVLLAAGVLGFLFAGQSFTTDPVSGTVQGESFLGFEANGWTNVLLAGSGLLLLLGAPTHWGAKGLSTIVGLVLGAASVIALVDKDDVFGIFAANGPTKLLLGAASALLLVLALLPRVGKGRRREPVVERDRDVVAPRGRVREHRVVGRERVDERDGALVGDEARGVRERGRDAGSSRLRR